MGQLKVGGMGNKLRVNPLTTLFAVSLLVLTSQWFLGQPTAQTSPQYKVKEPYTFPIKPGTPEWPHSPPEQFLVCELPKHLAQEMTTESLLETCLSHPVAFGVYVSHDSEDAFNRLVQNFTGYKELITRADLGEVFCKRVERVWKKMQSTKTPMPFDDAFALSRIGFYSQSFGKMPTKSLEKLVEVSLRIVNATHKAMGPCVTESVFVEFPMFLIFEHGVRITKNGASVESDDLFKALKAGYKQPGYKSEEVNKLIALTLGAHE